MKPIGNTSGIGAPLSPNRIGGDNFIRYIGDRLILPMTEGAGTTVRDRSPCGNDGTFKAAGEPAWERGRVKFDGTNDYIGLSQNFFSKADFVNGGTIEFYFKAPTQAATAHIIAIEGAWFVIFLSTGEIAFNIDGASGAPSSNTTGTPCDNEWHHFAGTWNTETNASVIIRVDAIQDGTSTQDIFDIDSLNRTSAIGSKYSGDDYFSNMTISFIRINAKAFSALEVLQEYLWNKWRN